MIEYLVDQNGQYISTLQGTAEEILALVPAGHKTVVLPPPRTTDWWNGADWVPIGTPPAYYFTFDYGSKTWVDSRSLAEVKAKRWEEVKLARNQVEFGGFYYKGNKFDSDSISQGRILAAVVFGKPVTWTLADAGSVDLELEDLQGLAAAMATHVTSVHARGRIAREAVKIAQSNAEVESVLF